jgi:cardiolipin synthase C
MIWYHFIFRLLIFCIIALMGGCASLPPNNANPVSYALQDTADTRIGKRYDELKKDYPEKAGFFLLSNGLDAFTARALLAQRADRSIDAQYYMIHNDLTGILFMSQLLSAADRGIKVRLLIDDMDLGKRDEGLSTLASHPNITLRIFNPFSRQMIRAPQFLIRFGSVTRRMHNKAFIVDNQITIVGGRNIGNEYFDANPILIFADLDILAIGPVVQEVSSSFDEYWNSSMAYPITTLRPDLAKKENLEKGRQRLAEYLSQESVAEYLLALSNSKLARAINRNEVVFNWGEARVLADHPSKLENYDTEYVKTVSSQIGPFLDELQREFLIFSPYFVPGKSGTKFLADLSKSGVRVRILTNSLASTDVGIVHAGYAKYRTTLLRAGVELYEMNKVLSKEQRQEENGYSGSLKASLHAKSFVFDRKQVFIGSLNLDPRSIIENTEIGIMVDSTELADTMAEGFDHIVKTLAFRLQLVTDEKGLEFISWHGLEEGKERTWTTDPHTSFWRRFGIGIMSLFPIESQL